MSVNDQQEQWREVRYEQWQETRFGSADGIAGYKAMYDGILSSDVSRGELLYSLSMPERYFDSPINRDARVLDGFCGTGRHARQALAMGFTDWTAFDYSVAMLELAAQALGGDRGRVTLRREDARKLSFTAESFDMYQILGTSALGFFDSPEDDARVVAEAHRVLRPGAFLIFDLVDQEYAAQSLADRTTVRAETHAGTLRLVVEQRTVRLRGGFLQTGHREYHVELTTPNMGKEAIRAVPERGAITIRLGDQKVAYIDTSRPGALHIYRRVYATDQVLELLREHRFKPALVPRAFTYGRNGEYGNMGVRNLYVGRKE